jgi:arylsulfatase A-like enzyme
MRALVIEASGLSPGYIGCYGNEWVATPTLDRLAAEGVVFDRHYCDCPDSTVTGQAWQTGRYHLPLPGEDVTAIPSQPTPSFPLLREHGVGTFLITNQEDRLDACSPAGWEYISPIRPDRSGAQNQAIRAVARALDRLSSLDQWLLKVELSTLLPPFHVPEAFRNATSPDEEEGGEESRAPSDTGDSDEPENGEDTTFLRLQDDYAVAVAYLDTGFGLILDELEKRGLRDDLLVIVTAERGQGLGERERVVRSGTRLHEALIHLPLLLRLPGMAEAGRRVSALTQTIDLLPTLLDAFGLPAPVLHGRSLLPLALGKAQQVRAYACAGLRWDDTVEWALRTPQWSFLLPVQRPPTEPPQRPQLYVKPDDRWEVNDVYQHHLELAEHLERVLRGFVEAARQPGPLRAPELGDPGAALAKREL